MKKLALHWQILIGIGGGILMGMILSRVSWGRSFVHDWIKPWGIIFMNLLKLVAVPLILTSLTKGITDLKSVSNFSKLGKRTFGWYVLTTFIALGVGLAIVNLIRPGRFLSEKTRIEMMADFTDQSREHIAEADAMASQGPLEPLINMAPDNIFRALGSNANMLQVIFFTILFSISMLFIPGDRSAPVKSFFDSAGEVILKFVDLIMRAAPFGVFALMVSMVAEAPSSEIFIALGAYSVTVIFGLAILLYVIYPLLIRYIAGGNPLAFHKAMAPAQLVAFSTSSAAASLPVTLRCIRERLKVTEEVSSFVVPIGATINMDGTTLYQAVAAVFIAQVFGYHLSFQDQVTLVFTAALAGFGAAAVPGAGILMLVIVLEAIGISPAGIALIFAVDRPLDMCRTVVNVTGDGMIAVMIQKQTDPDWESGKGSRKAATG